MVLYREEQGQKILPYIGAHLFKKEYDEAISVDAHQIIPVLIRKVERDAISLYKFQFKLHQ